MADSLESEELSESAAALLSMKDGGRLVQPLSPGRRGNPPRIRKRNRLIFIDEEDTSYSFSKLSPRKTPRVSSPPTLEIPFVANKRAAQKIGIQLRNLLKLPKAHRWVCYEWFYSNIDQPLFLGDNEFSVCIRESFPQLKTRKLRRVEWVKIRRLMGKPRRCSSAFFAEEREALYSKRNKICQLQQRKVADLTNYCDLPEEIPLPLVIGTKVTVRLHSPCDGLFMGSIDAVDTTNGTYRVTFDRSGLGSNSVPHYEVLSNEPQETMPISAFVRKERPRNMYYMPPKYISESSCPQLDNDSLLEKSSIKPGLLLKEGDTVGGFPVKFLLMMVRLTKILAVKKSKITELKTMNTEAEKMCSYQQPIPLEFQKKYALIILDFEKLNKDLNYHLIKVQQFCLEIAPERGLQPGIYHEVVKQRSLEEAKNIVEKWNNRGRNSPAVKNEKIIDLIANLTSLMLQVKNLAENELNSFELKSLSESLSEIQAGIQPQNNSVFQNEVEIHINHIQGGLSQMGNLHAFAHHNIFV